MFGSVTSMVYTSMGIKRLIMVSAIKLNATRVNVIPIQSGMPNGC